jgi:hypothetical protein
VAGIEHARACDTTDSWSTSWWSVSTTTAAAGEPGAAADGGADAQAQTAGVDGRAVAADTGSGVELREPQGLGRCCVERLPDVLSELGREYGDLVVKARPIKVTSVELPATV